MSDDEELDVVQVASVDEEYEWMAAAGCAVCGGLFYEPDPEQDWASQQYEGYVLDFYHLYCSECGQLNAVTFMRPPDEIPPTAEAGVAPEGAIGLEQAEAESAPEVAPDDGLDALRSQAVDIVVEMAVVGNAPWTRDAALEAGELFRQTRADQPPETFNPNWSAHRQMTASLDAALCLLRSGLPAQAIQVMAVQGPNILSTMAVVRADGNS